MGDMADLALDRELSQGVYAEDLISHYNEMQSRLKRHVWQSKDDGEFYIRDMETSHIKNCLRLLCNLVNENIFGGYFNSPYLSFIKLFGKELEKRGEVD